jgi:hypothetical protein
MIDYGTSLYVQFEVVFRNMLQDKDLAKINYRQLSLHELNTSRRFCRAEIIYRFRYSDLSDGDPPRAPEIAPGGEF